MEQTRTPDADIAEITLVALKSVLPRTKIKKVEVSSTSDLEILVVMGTGSSVKLTGKQLSDIHEIVSEELWKRGDERFPYFRYLTAQEAKSLAL